MKSEEVKIELGMGYQELVDYLLKKYGPAVYDYFVNETCRTKNKKVSRTSEGLVCHHIDEDKAIMLSNDKYAINNPFEYQKADRLVYCNILEHLILHVKIVEGPKPKNANIFEAQGLGGVVNYICPQLNDFYNGFEYKRAYEQNIFGVVADNFEDYIDVLQYFIEVLYNRHPEYLLMFSERNLAKSFNNGSIVQKVYDRIA